MYPEKGFWRWCGCLAKIGIWVLISENAQTVNLPFAVRSFRCWTHNPSGKPQLFVVSAVLFLFRTVMFTLQWETGFFPGLLDFTHNNLGQIVCKWVLWSCYTIQRSSYCLEAYRKAWEISDGYLLQHFAGLRSFCSLCFCLCMFLVFFFFSFACKVLSIYAYRLQKLVECPLGKSKTNCVCLNCCATYPLRLAVCRAH